MSSSLRLQSLDKCLTPIYDTLKDVQIAFSPILDVGGQETLGILLFCLLVCSVVKLARYLKQDTSSSTCDDEASSKTKSLLSLKADKFECAKKMSNIQRYTLDLQSTCTTDTYALQSAFKNSVPVSSCVCGKCSHCGKDAHKQDTCSKSGCQGRIHKRRKNN